MTDFVHSMLAHYASAMSAAEGMYVVSEAVYIGDISLLESHGWVECVKMVPEKDPRGEAIYKVKLTGLGRLEAGLPRRTDRP